MLPRNADLVPGRADNLGRLFAKLLLGDLGRHVGELDKGAPGGDAPAPHRLPPDLAGLLPRVAAKGDRGEAEGAVGDAAVQVHAPVVLRHLFVAVHVGGLGIFALDWGLVWAFIAFFFI